MRDTFTKFVEECKAWRESEIVTDYMEGRLWPTVLLDDATGFAHWREFRRSHGGSTRAEIRREISHYLSFCQPRAFAVILPLEYEQLVELEGAVDGRIDVGDGDGLRPWSEYYSQAISIQAFERDGYECVLLGLAETELEGDIDRWLEIPRPPGLISEAVEQAAAAWRRATRS